VSALSGAIAQTQQDAMHMRQRRERLRQTDDRLGIVTERTALDVIVATGRTRLG